MDLVSKYNVPAPRYTSYPTVPYWDNQLTEAQWLSAVRESFQATNQRDGISLYLHLPFCESLCTYCACNTRITVNHQVEAPYVAALLKEWGMYCAVFHEKPRLREIHLGGGTPTFFSPEHLRQLIEGILKTAEVAPGAEFSFEAHPDSTSREHLETLYHLGFRRVSFGIQDFNERVQQAIHRWQSSVKVQTVVDLAREIGYTSINFDLIYGLPFQTLESMQDTIRQAIAFRPDRVAFYSYAHVPWLKPGQRAYQESDLPKDQEKRQLYEAGRTLFLAQGYEDIGMDHFALPNDALCKAMKEGTLHRNFMGYTHQYTRLLIGLGASSISDAWGAFAQNAKHLETYLQHIREGKFPIEKGHRLNEEDRLFRRMILDLMCRHQTCYTTELNHVLRPARERLQVLQADDLVRLGEGKIRVTPQGRAFLRNIGLCLDARYWQKTPEKNLFSTAI